MRAQASAAALIILAALAQLVFSDHVVRFWTTVGIGVSAWLR